MSVIFKIICRISSELFVVVTIQKWRLERRD
jgi:hypothetical protein